MSRNAGKRERDRKARHALTFGLEADAVRQGPCVAMRNCNGPGKLARCRVRQAVIDDELTLVWDPAHIVSVGAGGGRLDLISLCSAHHRQQHDMGIGTFAALYGLDLRALADEQALAHEPPLGIRGLAAGWALHEAGLQAFGPYGYDLAALMAWTRRRMGTELRARRGESERNPGATWLPDDNHKVLARAVTIDLWELPVNGQEGFELCEQAGWPS